MSSNLTPTSFASAAAGQSRGSRSGDGTGDWSRREGRSTNGTLTFRRPINTPSNQAPQTASDVSSALPPLVTETLPAQSPSHPTDRSLRYSRDHLLSLFQANGNESADASNLFVSGWNPTQANGTARGWGKSSEGTVPQDPTVCWDAAGSVKPIGLQDMSAEDREMFADINSTLKPQPQKDGSQGPGGVNGRKISTSVSHGNGSGFNVSSPLSASRPTARRRETSDTNPFPSGAGLTSPLTSRAPRDDSSWFGRKGTDQKEPQQFEEPEEDASLSAAKASGLGTGGRSNTVGGTSSMWGASTAAASTAAVGAFGSFALPTVGDKRFGSTRGESRLAHLLPKQDGSETGGPGAKPNSSAAGSANAKESWRLRPRTDTDPFGEDTAPAGGAALDNSQQNANADAQAHQSFGTPMKNAGGDFGVSGLNMGSSMDNDGAASPETNPFRSPPAERGDMDHYQAAAVSSGLDKGMASTGGGVPDHSSNFGSIRGYPGNAFDGSDRSQTSSVGAKGFTGLGSIAGWGNALNTSTPDRERTVFSSAFGSSLFSPVTGELQSPGFGGGVPGVFGPPGGGGGIGATGSLRGTSKLGSLFPPSMQAQMVGSQDQDGSLSDSVPDLRQTNPLGAIGREAIGIQGRDMDIASARSGRGGFFDDLMDPTRAGGSVFSSGEQPGQAGMHGSTSSPMLQSQVYDSMSGRPSTDTPPNQPRIMVMPDRMRWVYLDPQGQTQGPFTGLEMNDWYKANFFTADLRVKKVEDTEFEPLGQLIRRIGNSREPFLVPQMGVAHGQPSLSGTFAHGDRGTVIPPLMGAFPSYGRTLTAEEQNNLERRKQEEQYMLARQREMLSVQHHPFPGGRVPPTTATGALHHHSSVHSLQSQPSFGSMTAPIGAGPPAIPGGLGGGQVFFDHPGMLPPTSLPGVSSGLDLLRDDIGAQDRQMLAGLQPTGALPGPFAAQQATLITNEMTTRSNLPTIDQLKKDPQGFSERLKEFQKLRENVDAENGLIGAGASSSDAVDIAREPVMHHDPQQAPAAAAVDEALLEHARKAASSAESAALMASLSLTQQVQQAQAAKRLAEQEEEDEIVQPAESHPDLPMPFPPPQGQAGTLIAAPTAQRSRSTLPDQYATSRSQSETPESSTVQPPPLAPWARDHGSESHKGPSLKEIQEAEAKKAAKAEEVALAARKAMAEQEAALLREREKAAATVAPGLPTSSTWAASSPTVAGSSSPWSKPGATSKPPAHGVTSGSSTHSAAEKKKTLADIQREEEARKQKSKELASLSPSSPAHSGTGKRYADLASKVQAPTPTSQTPASASPVPAAPIGSGWATVGAGGKVKTPSGPSVSRSASTSSPAVKAAPTLPATPRVASKQSSGAATAKLDVGGVAMEEFNKWLHRELGRGITSGIDLDGFVDSLLQLPLDLTIISEAVYASSKTMDGRHFAEEFIRRKKLAEKGVVEKQAVPLASGDSKSSGGWNEVAKKGGSSSSSHQKEESMPAGFKVVPSRKKGKK